MGGEDLGGTKDFGGDVAVADKEEDEIGGFINDDEEDNATRCGVVPVVVVVVVVIFCALRALPIGLPFPSFSPAASPICPWPIV